jgi:RNA polymerase sigma-70 factor (ECF subfamily)
MESQVRPSIAFQLDPEPPLADPVAAVRAPFAPDAAMPPVPSSPASVEAIEGVTFLELYETHLAFVWNGVRRLGVHESAVEDVVQEIFVVVHRKLRDFQGRSSIRTWLFGIAVRVVRHHRRKQRSSGAIASDDLDSLVDSTGRSPQESAEQGQMVDILARLLDGLDDDKREVLVLAELEQMTAPEIAEVTDTNLNTVYWRLRTARQEFERIVTRFRSRREGGLR